MGLLRRLVHGPDGPPRDPDGRPDLQALAERCQELAGEIARITEQINVTNLANLPPRGGAALGPAVSGHNPVAGRYLSAIGATLAPLVTVGLGVIVPGPFSRP